MKAYVHPCASLRDLMLMDSNYERRTFAELKRLQQFLANKQGIRVVIEKPMLDVRGDEDLVDPAIEAGEPCIPDFVLQTEAAPAGGAAVVVVETMGFAGENYRARKAITHRTIKATLRAPLVTHDFHFPEDQIQAERDRRFWHRARWSIVGSRAS
jgi:predicted nuclease of restriction endonuclease-like RecB superfamily